MNKWLMVVILFCIPLAETYAGYKQSGTPDFIPMPQSVQWSEESFDLSKCKFIQMQTDLLKTEALHLQQVLRIAGFSKDIVQSGSIKSNTIILRLEEIKTERHEKEAYRLSVTKNGIVLAANTAHGILNAIQTLRQLMSGDVSVKGCVITDYPAYQWRGYMVDVGRNYQSLAQLKQQIDIMARYKLNIFHFHLTEDIAWRLQIKKYPQLTAAEITERNKGKFYSIQEMKDLIRYCRERHIVLIPEIDIPGHSKAFTRAMGVDMQSEKGTKILKDIFEEICSTYDVPYLHIGADEVKITNQTLIAEISEIIRKHNKQIIAWAPGGNYDDHIIRQLWKEEGDKDVSKQNIKYIDSKFLYISDFDPLNSVVTIFNRQLGGKLYGDSTLLGAEFCLWNDRIVAVEEDLISKNPVYPSMLAFSERSWRGNGYPDVVFAIGPDGERRANDFREFEARLLSHKQKYFRHLPFIYVKQTHITWKLFGPFENRGNLTATFWPEVDRSNLVDSTAVVTAVGGTIWLWHTHGPKVKAWIPFPKENTTWYAFTRFWSNSDSIVNMWIDFKDLSRSGADATPPKGEWDYMQSKLWINKTIMPPPKWTFAGRPAGRLGEPMVDETYYFRTPARISVKKGWNEVLIKLPISSFDPNVDWQVPPKWMFTFVPIYKETGVNWEAGELLFRTSF